MAIVSSVAELPVVLWVLPGTDVSFSSVLSGCAPDMASVASEEKRISIEPSESKSEVERILSAIKSETREVFELSTK